MKRFVIAVLLAGCSAATESVEEQAQETTTTHGASNGFASPNLPTNKLCHPTLLYGSGAHSQAPVYGGFAVPKYGGAVIHANSGSLSSYPNANFFPLGSRQGLMTTQYECHDFTDFNGGGGGQSASIDLTWNQTTNLQFVSGSRVLWDFFSACWLDSVGHLSAVGEVARLNLYQAQNPSGWSWQLDVSGFPALMAGARCAWLGRNLEVATSHVATPGLPSTSQVSYSTGTCFIHDVEGNLDDGWVYWRHDNIFGLWQLEAGGQVTRAEGYCVRY